MRYPIYACQRCGNPTPGILGRFFDWLVGQHTHRCPQDGLTVNWGYFREDFRK